MSRGNEISYFGFFVGSIEFLYSRARVLAAQENLLIYSKVNMLNYVASDECFNLSFQPSKPSDKVLAHKISLESAGLDPKLDIYF